MPEARQRLFVRIPDGPLAEGHLARQYARNAVKKRTHPSARSSGNQQPPVTEELPLRAACEPNNDTKAGLDRITVLKIGGRLLKATVVFDTYWRFAARRQSLFMKRSLGVPPPWTDDPVLARYRFTNVYRASDRVSQYLISNVLYRGEQTAEEIFFRALLFKFFNRIQTWERMEQTIGTIAWRAFDIERYGQALDSIADDSEPIYSAAYIMPSPPFGHRRKHRNHLQLLHYMMMDRAPLRVESAQSLQEVFEILNTYPSIGPFLAFQYAIDLNYSAMLDFSEMDFVVAGPGAKRGIRKCFVDTAGLEDADVIHAVADLAPAQFERLGLPFNTLWGRPLHPIDCQNIFCEVDKYARVVHPSFSNKSSRTRIKQRFSPTAKVTPQWYPPKWDLNTRIAESSLT